ncbi:MAG: calcium/sodium antiporter [Patescibacteria group bacterium]
MSIILLILYFLALLLVFYLLARVCTRYFVDSLELTARKLNLSEDIAGATLMAFGGSAPEFLIVIITLIHPGNHANFGAGTIVGSAIFNILVVVGVAAIIHTSQLSWKPVVRDVVFYVAAIIALFLVFQDSQVFWFEALALLALYVAYLFMLQTWQKFLPKIDKEILLDELSDHVEVGEKRMEKRTNIFWKFLSFLDQVLEKVFINLDKHPKSCVYVFIESLIAIALLSWALVEIAIRMSHIINIPEAFIALTVVAVGTSIPDIIAASFMAKRGCGGMAIADALGSNIFDILFGFGLPWLVYTVITGKALKVSVENLHGSVLLLLATVIMIFLLLLLRHFKIGRSVGWLLIACYAGYIAYSILEILAL